MSLSIRGRNDLPIWTSNAEYTDKEAHFCLRLWPFRLILHSRIQRPPITRSACTYVIQFHQQTLYLLCAQLKVMLSFCALCSMPGLGNVRPAGHIRPAKHLNVAHELYLKLSRKYQLYHKTNLNSVYMDMYWPADI